MKTSLCPSLPRRIPRLPREILLDAAALAQGVQARTPATPVRDQLTTLLDQACATNSKTT